jgi:hypothetical protein
MKVQLQFKVWISSSVRFVKDGGRALGLLGKEIQKFAESGGAHADEKAAAA